MTEDARDWRLALEPRFGAALRRFFRRRTRDEDEACDLTQEVFSRLLRNQGSGLADDVDAYVFTTATNLLRERGRRAKVRGDGHAGTVATEIADFLANSVEDRTPERILEGREAVERLVNALGQLSERTRSIFILHRIEEMSQKDIARDLGISVSAVEKHVAKALLHLTQWRDR